MRSLDLKGGGSGTSSVDRVSDMTYLKLQALQRGEVDDRRNVWTKRLKAGSRAATRLERRVWLFCANRSIPTGVTWLGCDAAGPGDTPRLECLMRCQNQSP